MVRPILRYPAPLLKSPCKPVENPEDAARVLEDLVETMRATPGCVGLAANQIGEDLRAFCVDVSGHPKASTSHGLIALANPVVVHTEGVETIREGCMSVPDFTANVRRPRLVVVAGRDTSWNWRIFEVEGFEARAVQHEVDHLDGILFLDRVASLSSDLFRRKKK